MCIFLNVGLGTAAKKDVGTGPGQIPTMSNFTSGPGWARFPNGTIIQRGTSISGPLGFPTAISLPISFTSSFTVTTSFDSAKNGVTDCPPFATTPIGLGGFYLMSSRTGGGTGAGANWIAVGE
ncbi:gp53-like domain-containing protein [Cedecea neteri]|uniref:gp53-like domain-containing protein n=1 Tax=Cedecea neteri TaxID=158822 RepID=UPI003AF3296C